MESIAWNILSRYGLTPSNCRFVFLAGNGGFSGADIYRVHPNDSTAAYCLRRWPDPPDQAGRIRTIHSALHHAARRGIDFVPAPVAIDSGESLLLVDGSLWELAPWMSGTADYHALPSPLRFRNAVQAVGRLHATFAEQSPGTGVPPGVVDRLALAQRYQDGGIRSLARAVDPHVFAAGIDPARCFLDAFSKHSPSLIRELKSASDLQLPRQWCVRDLRHDHFLFEGDAIRGIVDFGALRIDHVSVDLARMFGSLVGEEQDGWLNGTKIYEAEFRKLEDNESSLLRLLDRANLLLSGLNWIRWIYEEKRVFEDLAAVEERMVGLAVRLLNESTWPSS